MFLSREVPDDGFALFAATAKRFPRFLRDPFAESDVAADELGTIVPHQASAAATKASQAKRVPGGHAKTIDIFRDHGNQIVAGMPHALHVAHGREQPRPAAATAFR